MLADSAFVFRITRLGGMILQRITLKAAIRIFGLNVSLGQTESLKIDSLYPTRSGRSGVFN
jgi:hypothetical protein